jgi:general stress protein CsbA
MENYLKDIQEIKKMMDKSSQFLSLSGLAGVMAGVYALIGAYAINDIATRNYGRLTLESTPFKLIVVIAGAVLAFSVGTALLLTLQKAKKHGDTVWNSTTKRMAANFLIPLVTGGLFALLLIRSHHYGLIAPITLIFYGLSCVSASRYTHRDVRYLGLTIIAIGLAATWYMGYGLLFWAIGFGICHILYGTIMYFKYDRKQ